SIQRKAQSSGVASLTAAECRAISSFYLENAEMQHFMSLSDTSVAAWDAAEGKSVSMWTNRLHCGAVGGELCPDWRRQKAVGLPGTFANTSFQVIPLHGEPARMLSGLQSLVWPSKLFG